MNERERLEKAIAALEAQRALLGNEIVDAGIAPIREKLAALEAQSRATQQRKLATVLFADVSGFTALAEMMDAEVVTGIMNDLWLLVDNAIADHGGRIDKHIGDAVMALWGAEAAREDDPEMAVRGALAMQAAIDEFCKTHSAPLDIRIGINTGPVLVGYIATTGEFTAMGDAVNLASRLEHAAPVGGVLISHNTYRHVRGVFDVSVQEPVHLKGKAEPVQTYLVLQAKPRAFRMATRGVEGVETRMIGREAEMLALQTAFEDALDAAEPRVMVVIGEAGVGKSRLLFEFDKWLERRPEVITYFKGRSTPNTRHVPYSLFRDLFAFRFNILDSDSAAVALDKFQAGMSFAIEPDQAAIAGHWLGFDFSASEAVQRLRGEPGFTETARAYLIRYLRGLLAGGPAVILLEDIHWADDSSLDLVLHLSDVLPAASLLVVAVTRPSLFERRPGYGEGEAAFQQVPLAPLSRQASQALVDEVLQRVDDIPMSLRTLIVDTAEGNPFYVEELVKMLIEQDVIEPVTSDERRMTNDKLGITNEEAEDADSSLVTPWIVRADRLVDIKVPPTLTGLLQARLDRLPPMERSALQRASVVGRLFWDDAVADLVQLPVDKIRPVLAKINSRELVFRRARSSFAQTEEYIFKHNLLRDVAYETVLLRQRIEYHRRVARWLEAHAGERLGEFLSLIAEHWMLAGESLKAASLLERSGYEAAATGANRAARGALERALTLREAAGQKEGPEITRTLITLGQVLRSLGDFAAAQVALDRGVAGARTAGDPAAEGEALAHLVFVLADRGQFDRAQSMAQQALALVHHTGGSCRALVLLAAASVAWSIGHLDSAESMSLEAIDWADEAGDLLTQCRALNTLGNINLNRRDLARADQYYSSALEKARTSGNLSMEATLLINLGNNAYLCEDYIGARSYTQAAKERLIELGERSNMPLVLINLAQANLKAGDIAAARQNAQESLSMSQMLAMQSMLIWGVFLCGQILLAENSFDRGLALFSLARSQPSPEHLLLVEIDEEVARLNLPADQIAAGLANGQALDLETVVEEILAGKW